ncbi:MAG TPA: hypothetical protein PLG38_13270 [Propionibacteriaceae bacterium]|nr:hypothetical protein [Propionibacteriaceae bacterium]
MNDTTWKLEEFDRHASRLKAVGESVATAGTSTQAARDSNGQAFGYLFGWAVTPVLNLVCGDVGDYSADLAEAMDASADGIEFSKKAYAATEQDNIDRVGTVEQELAQQQGRIG